MVGGGERDKRQWLSAATRQSGSSKYKGKAVEFRVTVALQQREQHSAVHCVDGSSHRGLLLIILQNTVNSGGLLIRRLET
jgi:hypothetical protein